MQDSTRKKHRRLVNRFLPCHTKSRGEKGWAKVKVSTKLNCRKHITPPKFLSLLSIARQIIIEIPYIIAMVHSFTTTSKEEEAPDSHHLWGLYKYTSHYKNCPFPVPTVKRFSLLQHRQAIFFSPTQLQKKVKMPIDFYTHPISPPATAVVIAAKALKVELNVKEIDLFGGATRTPEYLKVSFSLALKSCLLICWTTTRSTRVTRFQRWLTMALHSLSLGPASPTWQTSTPLRARCIQRTHRHEPTLTRCSSLTPLLTTHHSRLLS